MKEKKKKNFSSKSCPTMGPVVFNYGRPCVEEKGSQREAEWKRLRNQDNRARAKLRKARRQVIGQDWRRRNTDQDKKSASGFSGYFSACSEDTQRELRETRAKLLIVKNETQTAMEKAKLENALGPMAEIQKANALARAMLQIRRNEENAGGDRVVGWARTLSEAASVEIAKTISDGLSSKCSSSVQTPVFDGTAASCSTRRGEYLKKKADLELCLHLPDVDEDEILGKLTALDVVYEDVRYDEKRQAHLDVVKSVAELAMSMRGAELIGTLLKQFGFESDFGTDSSY